MEFFNHLHPLTVHFPIAFLVLYVCLEIISQISKNKNLRIATHIVLLVGTISGIFSVLTGNYDYQTLLQADILSKVHLKIISNHEYFATLTIWYFFSLLIFKTYIYLQKKNQALFNYLFVILACIGFYFLYKTAQLGGRLVYEFGIGTNIFN